MHHLTQMLSFSLLSHLSEGVHLCRMEAVAIVVMMAGTSLDRLEHCSDSVASDYRSD